MDFLLTYTEKGWDIALFQEMISRYETNGYVNENWRIASHKKAKAGDRVWVLRQGQKSKVIFGVGEITGIAKIGDAGDGTMKPMAPIRFHMLVDPDKGHLIDEQTVRHILKPEQLNARASGQKIPGYIAAQLDDAISEAKVFAARVRLRSSIDGKREPPAGSVAGIQKATLGYRFLRDREVIAWVLETANGVCEICYMPAPFLGSDKESYLEIHHVRPLSEGGPDKPDNTVAVCPNCHRRMHHSIDREELRNLIVRKIPRIIDCPRSEVR